MDGRFRTFEPHHQNNRLTLGTFSSPIIFRQVIWRTRNPIRVSHTDAEKGYFVMQKNGRKPGRPPTPPKDRFWARVKKTSTCWLWTGALSEKGYGRIRINEKVVRAHRFSWELAGGVIPEGMFIDHVCHTRHCVNPEHLRVVTSAQNSQNQRGPHKGSTTDYRGVYLPKNGKRYRATIGIGGKTVDLGGFDTAEAAAKAAKDARLQVYTHNDLDRA